MCWFVQCDGRGLQDRKLNRSGVETKDRNKKRKHLIRDEDEAAEEHQRSPHRGACCWPFARRKEKRLGFLENWRKKKAKKALADRETIVPMG